MRLHLIICAGVLCLVAARPAPAEAPPARIDQLGDPLPSGARFRLGTTRFWHRVSVEGVAFSPDGALLATGGCDELRIWDAATGKERFCSTQVTNGRALAFSADGKVLAAGGSLPDDKLTLLAMPEGKILHQIRTGHEGIGDLLFAPDGNSIITAGRDGHVRFWDLATARQVRNFVAHKKEIVSLALSPDGKKLLTGSQDHNARLWDLATGKELSRFPCADYVNSVCFHPDGALIALGADDKKIHLWNVATGKKVRELEGPPSRVCAVAFSPDGKLLAATNWQGHTVKGPDGKETYPHLDVPAVTLWDPATGKPVRRWGQHGGTIYRLRFSPDGKRLATAGSKLRLWETATGEEVPALAGHQWSVCSLAVSPDGRTLASRSDDKSVRTWDLATGKEICSHLLSDRYLSTVCIAPDGKTLVWRQEKSLRVAELSTGKTLPSLNWDAANPVFSADGRRLAAVGDQNKVFIVDFPGRRLVRDFKVESNSSVMSLAISPDGKLIACGCYDGIAFLMDPATGKAMRKLEGHRGWCSGVAFSPDGTLLLTGGDDGTARLWAVPSGKPVGELQAEGQTLAVAFSPDGRLVAAGQSGSQALVQVWEVATLGERLRYAGHKSMVESLAFSPDGRLLFTGSNDTTILAWDVFAAHVAPARTADALAQAWNDLGSSEAARAFASVRAMIAAPREATAFLAQRLRPVSAVDARRLGKLLNDLDSQRFEVREQAREELEQLEELARAALKSALEHGRPSLEQRTRIERLLELLDSRSNPDRLRWHRSLEVLEQIGSSESRRLLKSLADGATGARTTLEARAAFDRLESRKQQ